MVMSREKALAMAKLFKVLRNLGVRYEGYLIVSQKMDLGAGRASVYLDKDTFDPREWR
jgi:hypothetical protein